MARLRFASLALLLPVLAACPDESSTPTPDTAWKQAFDAESTGWLLSVWGPSPTELFATGGSPDAGVVMHFDGSSWAPLDLPPGTPLISWSYGFAADDVTFVGDAGTILHYDGASFEAQPSSTTENLWGTWGASPSDLWAVGGSGRTGGVPTLLHYDGAAWTTVPLPTLQKANVNALFKVWGTDATNVYAVGQRGTVLHYDGTQWNEELVGASDDLISLWGTDASHVYAVGGRGNAIVSRFDGKEWRTQSLAPLSALNGVFMRTPGVVHVVGISGTIATIDGETLTTIERESFDTSLDLHATFAVDGTLYAVGGSLASTQPPYRGIALRRELTAEE